MLNTYIPLALKPIFLRFKLKFELTWVNKTAYQNYVCNRLSNLIDKLEINAEHQQ